MSYNVDKISKEYQTNPLVGVTGLVVKLKGQDNPFYVLDNMNTVDSGLVVGAGMTRNLTSDYRINQQRVASRFVVGATGAKTLTWTKTIDLSSGFFDSYFDPVFNFGIYVVKGATSANTALTVAERTVKVKIIDTSNVEFANGVTSPNVDVDEFDYILGAETTGTLNLDNTNHVFEVNLSKLENSTVKKFGQVQITFALPEGAEFVTYKKAFYRQPMDSLLGNRPDIVLNNPKNFTITEEGEDKKITGVLGETIAVIEQAQSMGGSAEAQTFNPWHALSLMGQKIVKGGTDFTTTSGTIVAGKMQVSGLEATSKPEDITIKIEQGDGTYREAFLSEGGNYLQENQVRYYRDGANRAIQFSSGQVGKKFEIIIFKKNDEIYRLLKSAIPKRVNGDVYQIITDTANYKDATTRLIPIAKNCVIKSRLVTTGLDNDGLTVLNISWEQLVTDVTAENNEMNIRL